MGRPIFLSYRRTDSAGATARLYTDIGERFGTQSVYMDTASMAWGERWATGLERAVTGAAFVIAVIGPDWLRAADEWGRRRIDLPDDWVRRELELALSARKEILPLLLYGVAMPPAHALPPELATLPERQAFTLDEGAWREQVEAVLGQLGARLRSGLQPSPQHPPPTIREEFEAIASRFYRVPLRERKAAAEELFGIGDLLPLAYVLGYARSPAAERRVGAAIALGSHLSTSPELADDPAVDAALRKLLRDRRERVRYRAAEALRRAPVLVGRYEGELSRLAAETNRDVSGIARSTLRRNATLT
jgi:hypothetical protein